MYGFANLFAGHSKKKKSVSFDWHTVYMFWFIIMLLGYFVKTHIEEITKMYNYLKRVLRSQTQQSYMRKILFSRVALKI